MRVEIALVIVYQGAYHKIIFIDKKISNECDDAFNSPILNKKEETNNHLVLAQIWMHQ